MHIDDHSQAEHKAQMLGALLRGCFVETLCTYKYVDLLSLETTYCTDLKQTQLPGVLLMGSFWEVQSGSIR
jgi:hypothetical protein